MTRSIRFLLLAITVASLVFWAGVCHIPLAVDQTPRPSVALSDLIQEALAQNPEIASSPCSSSSSPSWNNSVHV